MLKVLTTAGAKVIDDDHLVPTSQKKFGEVRADKPTPTGDQDTHEADPELKSESKIPGKIRTLIVPTEPFLGAEKFPCTTLLLNFADFVACTVKG
jgi:hypothetical protein